MIYSFIVSKNSDTSVSGFISIESFIYGFFEILIVLLKSNMH